MASADSKYEELLTIIRIRARNQNGGFLARFGTSDVVQETALQLVKEERKNSVDTVDRPSNALLTRITATSASKLRRLNSTKGRGVKLESSADTESLAESNDPCVNTILNEQSTALVLALSRLSETQKKIIDAHYRQYESFTKIAADLNLNPRYVQRQHQRALMTLRGQIELSQ